MLESARFVETADELREVADIEFPFRALIEFELTPGVRLELREVLLLAEEFRPAGIVELDERFAAFAEFVPFTPPRTELFAFAPPPWRPKYG